MNTHIKRILTGLLILAMAALPVSTVAQPGVSRTRTILFAEYDLDSTTAISCSYGPPRTILIPITTSGSSTTVAAVTSGSAPYNLVSVGDLIMVNITSPGAAGSATVNTRIVTARASADSITVDTAITIPATGLTFQYQKRTCGADSGWVSVENVKLFTIATQLDQISVGANSIRFQIQGRYLTESNLYTSFNLWPGTDSATADCGGGTFASGYCTYTTANTVPPFVSAGMLQATQVRLVTNIVTADDGTDTGADAESITAVLIAERN